MLILMEVWSHAVVIMRKLALQTTAINLLEPGQSNFLVNLAFFKCNLIIFSSKWNKLPPMSHSRLNSGYVIFNDKGKEKIWNLGGRDDFKEEKLANSEIFDGNQWIEGPSSPMADEYEVGHCLVQLDDSRTLLIGGEGHTKESFIYDWGTKLWRKPKQGSLHHGRENHACALLPDGKIVVIGGDRAADVEIFDPENEAFYVPDRTKYPVDSENSIWKKRLIQPRLVRVNSKLLLLGGLLKETEKDDGIRLSTVYEWSDQQRFFVPTEFELPNANYDMACGSHGG